MAENGVEFPTPEYAGPFDGMLVTGPRETRFRGEFGIYGPDGTALPMSDIAGDELTTFPADQMTWPEDHAEITGPTLFAGLVMEQFGHVLMNSLGRLWALQHLPADTTLVFVPKRKPAPRNYPHLRTVLDMLGVRNDFVITKGPMRLREVYTARDLFGERYGGLGAPEFFAWLDGRLPASGPVDPARKVYLSRSGLGMDVGRFACEDHLETLLAAQGYEIIAPETLSLAEQVALYQSAGRLIFAEGSALHLFSMLRRPEQKVAVILRRDSLPQLIRTQMQSRPGTPVAELHALRRVFWPPRRSDHLSVSLLDFKALRKGLVAADLLAPDAPWEPPSFEAEAISLEAGLEPGEAMLDLKGRREWLRALRKARDGKAW